MSMSGDISTTATLGPEYSFRSITPLAQKWVMGIILIVICFWLAYPWWPLKATSLESDSVYISYGVAQLIHDSSPEDIYRFECQPGTYQSILWLSRNSPLDMQPLVAFRILTIIGFICFAVSSVSFLGHHLGYPKWFCFFSWLLFPEVVVSSYYPNSNMLALPWAMTALAILSKGNSWQRCSLAGVLYGIGVWMRVDLVLICLAFPVVMKPQTRSAWGKVGLVTCLSVAISNGLIWLSGVSLTNIVATFRLHHEDYTSVVGTFWIYAVVFTALTVLTTVCGFCRLWIGRDWKLLALFGVAFIPSVLCFGFSVTTPKYLLYSLTFVSIASSAGLWWLLHSTGRTGRIVVASLFLLQYLLNPFAFHAERGNVATHDYDRQIGFICGSVSKWHDANINNLGLTNRVGQHVRDYLAKEETGVIVMRKNSLRFLVPYQLLLSGYEHLESKGCHRGLIQVFERDGRKVALVILNNGRTRPFRLEELGNDEIINTNSIQVLGVLKPRMVPFADESRRRGTGKYGSCIFICRKRSPPDSSSDVQHVANSDAKHLKEEIK